MSGFSFPPPPPPPPKPSSGSSHHGAFPRGGRDVERAGGRRGDFRGRGDRGRGSAQAPSSRGPQRGPANPPAFFGTGPPQHTNTYAGSTVHRDSISAQSFPSYPTAASPPRTAAGQKRKLDVLRGTPSKKPERKPAPETAPAIPTFGAPLLPTSPVCSSSKPSDTAQSAHVKEQKPKRSLGLTPAAGDPQYSSSDEENDEQDLDEEALYAELGDKLTFEHNGVVVALNSQADLLAWKKDRQKNWPTKARMETRQEEKRRVGEERRRLLVGVDALNSRKSQFHKPGSNIWTSASIGERPESQQTEDIHTNAKLEVPETELEKAKREMTEKMKRLDELRKKVADSEIRNRKAREQKEHDGMSPDTTADESALTSPMHGTTSNGIETDHQLELGYQPVPGVCGKAESSDESSSEEDLDSSADDASSDEGPPEETTSKPVTITSQGINGPPVCRYFRASGWCREGDACRFRHETVQQKLRTNGHPTATRNNDQSRQSHFVPNLEQSTSKKSIFQRLVEQEEEEDDRLALRVIKHLGEAGFF